MTYYVTFFFHLNSNFFHHNADFFYFLLAVLFIIFAPWIKYKLHTPRLSKAVVSQQFFCGFSLLDFMSLNVLTQLFQTNAPFIHIWLEGRTLKQFPNLCEYIVSKDEQVLLGLLVFKDKFYFLFYQL